MLCVRRCSGSFSEDRPLGWDPVAEGNRAGDGMARFVSEEKAPGTRPLLSDSLQMLHAVLKALEEGIHILRGVVGTEGHPDGRINGSGSRPIAASVWLGCPLPQALADET